MRIRFLCHAIDPPWTPHSTRDGIGGSEEAVIHLAAALAACGADVAVCNATAGPPRRFGRVAYLPYGALRPLAAGDIAIVWRSPALVARHAALLGCARTYLWLHDLLDEARVRRYEERFARIMVLSRFHASLYPHLPSDKVWITRNGIDPAQFRDAVPRDPRKVVYGSVYTRGLAVLLRHWSFVRRLVPCASLSVFYGWQAVARQNPQRYPGFRRTLEPMLAQEGVIHRGRLGHADVAREYLSAGVWAYPATFAETSCITAMKAQAGGAVPVVFSTGALRETVRFGYRTLRSFTDDAERRLPRGTLQAWLAALVDYLRHPDKQEAVRQVMMPRCQRDFAWSGVARQWLDEFSR